MLEVIHAHRVHAPGGVFRGVNDAGQAAIEREIAIAVIANAGGKAVDA
ncbi:hypothetical protein G7L47_25640 [Shigella sonnei]|nr:hypothetical protein [Shigella sonnei]